MKVVITRESLREFKKDFYYWKDMPELMVIEAQPFDVYSKSVEEKCESVGAVGYSSELKPAPHPIIEELDSNSSLDYESKSIHDKLNEVIQRLNSIR